MTMTDTTTVQETKFCKLQCSKRYIHVHQWSTSETQHWHIWLPLVPFTASVYGLSFLFWSIYVYDALCEHEREREWEGRMEKERERREKENMCACVHTFQVWICVCVLASTLALNLSMGCVYVLRMGLSDMCTCYTLVILVVYLSTLCCWCSNY